MDEQGAVKVQKKLKERNYKTRKIDKAQHIIQRFKPAHLVALKNNEPNCSCFINFFFFFFENQDSKILLT